jgi:hypothetical protein
MKGLILDGFYKNISNMIIMASFTLIFSLIILISGYETLLPLFYMIAIVALSAASVSSMRKDGEVKWDRFALTLPVRRNVIVKCKYISYLLWILAGIVTVAIVTAVAVSIHGNIYFVYGMRDVFNLYSLGIGIALLTGAFFFPFAYLLGADKSEVLLVISVITAIGLAIFFVWLLNISERLSIYARQGLFVLIVALIYGISFLITLGIYQRKEF